MANWINNAIQHAGSFTRKSTAADLTPAQFQAKVLANPAKYPSVTVRQANLRQTLVGMKGHRI